MLSDYSKYEARAAFRPYHLAVLAGCMAGSVGLSFLLPSMPEAIYRFFRKVFAMNNWTEIILINDFVGVFFALYWVGVVDLLRVYALPKEEGYLELLLSKPLGRTRYLFTIARGRREALEEDGHRVIGVVRRNAYAVIDCGPRPPSKRSVQGESTDIGRSSENDARVVMRSRSSLPARTRG